MTSSARDRMHPNLQPGIGFTVFPYEMDGLSAACAADFIEVNPAAWLTANREQVASLHVLADSYPIVVYGDMLRLGEAEGLSFDTLYRLRDFVREYRPAICGEVLTLSAIRRTDESLHALAARILALQDRLGRRLAITNAAYCPSAGDLSDGEFLAGLAAESDCDLVLDLCNLYLNSRIQGDHPLSLVRALPAERVCLIRVAECENVLNTLPWRPSAVGDLLAGTYAELGAKPTVVGSLGGKADLLPLAASVRSRLAAWNAAPARCFELSLASLERVRPVANAAHQGHGADMPFA